MNSRDSAILTYISSTSLQLNYYSTDGLITTVVVVDDDATFLNAPVGPAGPGAGEMAVPALTLAMAMAGDIIG